MANELATNELLVVGLNHKTAPLHIREQLALAPSVKEALTKSLKQSFEKGSVVLSTCNRVEFYTLAQKDTSPRPQDIVDLLASQCQLSKDELQKHLYTHQNNEALHHLFRVASSLDSLVVGEPQILGQLKEALEDSRSIDCGGQLSTLMERAFLVARKVRSQTGISKHVVSVSSIAVKLALHIFEDLKEKTVLLIGAGEMAELAAKHLCQEGVGRLLVANRSLERAANLAESLGGSPRTLQELPTLLSQADIVISSTGAREPIIDLNMAQNAVKARKYKPLFMIDIAVPRDIAREVSELENIYVYDVDDLSQIADQNHAQRQAEAQEAERLVELELHKYHKESAQRELGPMIAAVRQQVHHLKAQEQAWAMDKLSTPADQAILKQFGDRLSNKLLHEITMGIKRFADHPQRDDMLNLVAELFALNDEQANSAQAVSTQNKPNSPS